MAIGRKRNGRMGFGWVVGSWISEDERAEGMTLGGERMESSAAAGREAIFSLCPHHSLLFFLRLPLSFLLFFPRLPAHISHPCLTPPYLLSTFGPVRSRSSVSQSELAARQMKIYRSPCPVGGFNLICHGVVAETAEGRNSRWTLLLVKRAASEYFYALLPMGREVGVDTRSPKSPRTCH